MAWYVIVKYLSVPILHITTSCQHTHSKSQIPGNKKNHQNANPQINKNIK